MSDRDYCPGGCTALIDALGSAIKHIVNIHRYVRKEDVPEKTVFVIITDGLENASHIFSASQVKKMIEHEKRKYGWEFLFLGANIDAVKTAASYGIGADRAVEYCSDGQGTAVNYSTVSVAVENLRTGKCLNADWMLPIAQDKKSRG